MHKHIWEIALTELADIYNSIYSNLEELLTVKVTEGNRLSKTLVILEWIFSIAIIVVIAAAMMQGTVKRLPVR